MTKPYSEPGIADLAKGAFDDARRWGRAELGFYKALATDRGGDAGIGIGMAVTALIVLQAALTAMLVGIILALSSSLGAGVATLIVVAVTLVVVAVLGWAALGRFRRAARPVGKEAP